MNSSTDLHVFKSRTRETVTKRTASTPWNNDQIVQKVQQRVRVNRKMSSIIHECDSLLCCSLFIVVQFKNTVSHYADFLVTKKIQTVYAQHRSEHNVRRLCDVHGFPGLSLIIFSRAEALSQFYSTSPVLRIGIASADRPLGNASPNGNPNGTPGGDRTRLHVLSRARLHVATTAGL